ncbi:MAG: pyridoxal phosphate-dependent aminotransferase [Oscillospiraceae bacterium]|nr:pyridoxal phosphate-dependent aminotransferase [Oscillospiraceae bacterium]
MTDFEKKYYWDRRGSGCAKWDGMKMGFGSDDLIAMWVADMDFRCPDSVREAMVSLAEMNTYGYTFPSPAYYRAFIDWELKRHGYRAEQPWIRYTPGVVCGIYRFLGALTQPGDACIILSPCYYPFMSAVEDTGRRLVCSILKNEGGYYTPDFADFEETIVREKVRAFILCSPHNPVGRVWTKEELAKLLAICEKHGVFVISDEIHQDLELTGKHVPTLAAYPCEKFAVMLTAASKTFNMAGLSHSIAVVPDEELRKKYDAYCKPFTGMNSNMTGYVAVEAAYRGGEAWLEGCLDLLRSNARWAEETLTAALPGVTVSPLEGTYLQWVDLGAYLKQEELKAVVQDECRIAVDWGHQFFPSESRSEGDRKAVEAGKTDAHIRLNLATSRENVELAVTRLIDALKKR